MPSLIKSYLLLAILCVSYHATLAADEPAQPKIFIQRVMLDGIDWKIENSPEKPFIIASQEELEKAFPDDKATQAKIKEAVDLSKFRLVVFAWQGSGKDRLELASPNTNEGGNITFTYRRGLTRDLRKHVNIYALPLGHKFEVAVAK